MAERQFSVPRGTSDILPEDASLWQEIEEKSRRIFKLYGYQELRTPLFEDVSLFKRSLGQTSEVVSKQLLGLVSQKEEGFALRPEGTASIVRSYIENSFDKKESLSKIYYIGPMFRGERPQKGRLRQFHQIGVEAIGPGASFALLDAEVIILAMQLLKEYGLTGHELRINTIGSAEDKRNFAEWLRGQLKSKTDQLCEAHQQSYSENVFRVLDCKSEQCRGAVAGLKLDYSYLSGDSKAYFEEVKKALSSLNIPFKVDPKLVRGLDYYTHTVFEICHSGLGSQDAVGAGGRYNNLVADLGGDSAADICAVGFSLGFERILLSRQQTKLPEPEIDVIVVAMDEKHNENAFHLLNEIRRSGLSADMNFHGGSMKSQMRFSNKKRAKYVMILGDEEVKNDQVTLKNMQNGNQDKISLLQLKEELKKLT